MLTRRTVIQGMAAAGAAALVHPGRAQAASTALPVPASTVDMELLLKAAQWDPVKPGTNLVPGAGPSVMAVENALVARGFLDPRYADGYFGTATVAAYAAYQRSLGYTGLGANGLPGPASLRALGSGRFGLDPERLVTLGARVTFDGVPLSARTRDMLVEAERLTRQSYPQLAFPLEQGSYSPGFDPTSAGSHDGGGAVDVHAVDMTPAQRTALCAAMRRVGFAAWVRNPSQADWPWHIHGIAILDTDLSPLAQKQVGQYFEGRNALASNLPDDGPQVTKVTWEEYKRRRV